MNGATSALKIWIGLGAAAAAIGLILAIGVPRYLKQLDDQDALAKRARINQAWENNVRGERERSSAWASAKPTAIAAIDSLTAQRRYGAARLEAKKWADRKDPDLIASVSKLDRQEREFIERERVARAAAAAKIEATKVREDRARRKREGVSIGMSADEVLMSSWGKPESINRTVLPGRIHEQWVYGPHSYVYVDDGVVTAIQNSR